MLFLWSSRSNWLNSSIYIARAKILVKKINICYFFNSCQRYLDINWIFQNFRKSDSMSNKRIDYPEMITFRNISVQEVYLWIFLTSKIFCWVPNYRHINSASLVKYSTYRRMIFHIDLYLWNCSYFLHIRHMKISGIFLVMDCNTTASLRYCYYTNLNLLVQSSVLK